MHACAGEVECSIWTARTSVKEGLGFFASSCVMSSLISALTSLLADRPRSVPNSESSSCACLDTRVEG